MEGVTCARSLYHILWTDIFRGKDKQKENRKVLSDTLSAGQLCQSCDIFKSFPIKKVLFVFFTEEMLSLISQLNSHRRY